VPPLNRRNSKTCLEPSRFAAPVTRDTFTCGGHQDCALQLCGVANICTATCEAATRVSSSRGAAHSTCSSSDVRAALGRACEASLLAPGSVTPSAVCTAPLGEAGELSLKAGWHRAPAGRGHRTRSEPLLDAAQSLEGSAGADPGRHMPRDGNLQTKAV